MVNRGQHCSECQVPLAGKPNLYMGTIPAGRGKGRLCLPCVGKLMNVALGGNGGLMDLSEFVAWYEENSRTSVNDKERIAELEARIRFLEAEETSRSELEARIRHMEKELGL